MFHLRLLLFFPWRNEQELIGENGTYQESYTSRQHTVNENGKKFNQDSEIQYVAMDSFNKGMVPSSAWDSLQPKTGQDEYVARCTHFTTLQEGGYDNDTCDRSSNGNKEIERFFNQIIY